MFYDKFVELCSEKGISPSAAALECGASKAAVSHWKADGRTPRQELLSKIADYFDVSTDYLMGKTELRSPIQLDEVDELHAYLDELRNRSELRMLFSVAKGATKEDVEKVVKIFEIMKGTYDD